MPTQLLSYEDWYKQALANNPNIANTPNQGRGAYNQYVARNTDVSSLLGQAGGGTAEQQRVGAQAGGSYADDSRDAGNASTGDPYIDELRSGKVASSSEDWRRYTNNQLNIWKPYYIGGGKFRNKYGDIVGKPIDSGPNTPKGFDGMGNPIQGYNAGAGAGGGGGNAQPTGQNAGINGTFQPQNPLQQKLMEMVGGQQGFFGENPYNNAASLKGGGVWWGQGADFSQAFNPLNPVKKKTPAAGPAQQTNPFQQASQQVQFQSTPNSGFTTPQMATNPVLPQYKQDMLSQITQNRNPMVGKLSQIYRGGI